MSKNQVQPPMHLDAIQNFKGPFPKQLYSLAFTEMWERFCFYGNRALLTIFMVDKLGFTEGESNLKYGAIQAFVYAFTFLGGLVADKILGFKKSLVWGGVLMIAANAILFIDAEKFFYPAMCLLILGTGFFKPNISTMVGELYKDGDKRRDAGFNLFYAGINLGATFAGIVCVLAAKKYGYNVSFGLSAIFIAIGLLVFLITKKQLGPIGNTPEFGKKNRIFEYIVYAGGLLLLPLIFIMIKNTAYTDLFMYIVGPLTIVYLVIEIIIQKLNQKEILKLCAAMVFIISSIFFWAFFEQSGGSLNLFAKNNLDGKLLGFSIDPNVVNNSSNSFIVFLTSPFIGLLWVWLSKKKSDPNYVIKFGLGFLFLALAFYVFYSTKFTADVNGIASLNRFTLAYLIISIAELCISPIGLSLMTMLAPKKLWGVMMGLWFLASAYGQYIAGILGAGMTSANENATKMEKLISYTDGYKQLAIYALIAGIILIILSPLIMKLMKTNENEADVKLAH
jgi:proton-dependent oligopeptide transporter, POT family